MEEFLVLRLCARNNRSRGTDTLDLSIVALHAHPLFFFLVVHPACWGRSQLQGPLVTRKLLLEMLSKVDNSTETLWDQGPRLALEGVFLATCVFGTL